MKAYYKYSETFRFPDDMREIMAHLETHGVLCVGASAVEEFYEQFSDEVYCAQWMAVNGERLVEFADWLSEQEIEDEQGRTEE